METKQTAAVTAAPGSVATPGTQTTPATQGAQTASKPDAGSQAPMSRDGRRTQIADWLKPQAPATSATPSETETTSADAGEGSQPAEGEGTQTDLSQSTPADAAETGAEGDEAEAGAEGSAADEAGEADDRGRWPKDAIARVRKLKEKRRELQGQLQQRDEAMQRVEAELRELKAQVKGQGKEERSQDAVSGETDPALIRERAGEAGRVHQWAEDLLDEVVDDPEGVASQLVSQGFKEPAGGWDSKSLRQTLRSVRDNARGVLNSAPKRLQFLHTEEQSLTQAITLEPELGDPESPLASEVNRIVVERPWLRLQPDWPLLALAGAIGLREIERRRKETGSGAGNTKQPDPVPAKAAAAAVQRAPRLPGAPRAAVGTATASATDEVRERAIRPGATRGDRRAYISQAVGASFAKK